MRSGRLVAVVGDVADDHYLELPPGPSTDEKTTALSSRHLLGGTGANAGAAASRLGSDVQLFSSVGDDAVADWLRDALRAVGVGVDGVATVPGASTQALVLLRGDRREVIVERGVAERLEHVDVGSLDGAGLVYTSCAGPTVHRLLDLGRKLVVGVEDWMVTPQLRADLLGVRCVVTNRPGYAALGPLPVTVVETRGIDGVFVHDHDRTTWAVPALVVHAVDATGAGDAFAGALCHYLAAGSSLTAAVDRAVVAAALSTLAFGAQGALPSAVEVEELMHRSGGTRS